MSESNIMAYVNHSFTLTSRFITSRFSLLIVFRWIFTLIALGNVDLLFSLVLIPKANAVEEETTWASCLYHQRNQLLHVADGVTMTSLSANLQHKTKATTDRVCQIALNRKLGRKFEKCFKFSSSVKAISHKKKSRKRRLACFLFNNFVTYVTEWDLNPIYKDKFLLYGLDNGKVWWLLANKVEISYLENLYTCCVGLCVKKKHSNKAQQTWIALFQRSVHMHEVAN